jgi:hypothetical protein
MKKLWVRSLLCTLLFSNGAAAEPLPSGCYVTDAWRNAYSGYFDPTVNYAPPPCHYSGDGLYSWFDPSTSSRSQLIGFYGEPMTAVIETVFLSNLQSLTNFNAYKKQVALVKKLRRACGTKCKKIK